MEYSDGIAVVTVNFAFNFNFEVSHIGLLLDKKVFAELVEESFGCFLSFGKNWISIDFFSHVRCSFHNTNHL